MVKILPIKNTLEVLCSCWKTSEISLQKNINNLFPDSDEVQITKLFHGYFKDSLDSANKENAIANAFIRDLKKEFPFIDHETNLSRKLSNGLIAEVKLHKPATEKITGGDLGFVISRPNLFMDNQYASHGDLIVAKQYRRGILTQAKLKDGNGKWGKFTQNQEKILPQHIDFLALLLYSYNDQNRQNFEDFRWQLCKNYPFLDLEEFLKRDSFPNLLNSCRIINDLGEARIGTDEPQKIDEIICPPENQSLTIDIHWPDDEPTGSRVRIRTRQQEKQEAKPVTW